MQPLISVVIPTYNRKDLVVEATQSILLQEPKNFEVVIIDDGSTDGTKEYIDSLKLPVIVISKKHGGISSARNEGIKYAKGEYIAFLDSDDVWLPTILKSQLEFLESNPHIPLVYTDQYIESNGEKLEKTRFSLSDTNHQERSKFNLTGFMKNPPIHISSVMVRKSIFDEIGLFNEDLKIHEDTDMWNRISQKYELGYIEKPLSIFRWEKDPEHILNPKLRDLFITEGRKYLKIYSERIKGTATQEEKDAIEESYKRLDLLKEVTKLQQTGQITEDEFNRRKDKIFR